MTWELALALVQNVLLWGLIGYWYAKVRRLRRIEDDLMTQRATVEANLRRAEALFGKLLTFPGDDGEPTAPLQ